MPIQTILYTTISEIREIAELAVGDTLHSSVRSRIAVVFACMTVEAAVNDIILFPDNPQSPEMARVRRLYKACGLEGPGTPIKRRIAALTEILDKPADWSAKPWQDLLLAFRVRNALTHPRPEEIVHDPDRPIPLNDDEIVKQLASRGAVDKKHQAKLPLAGVFLWPDLGKRAVAVADSCILLLGSLLPNEPAANMIRNSFASALKSSTVPVRTAANKDTA